MRLTYSATSFLETGLKLKYANAAQFENSNDATNLGRFKDFYYACPQTCEQLFIAIQGVEIDGKLLKNPRPDRLLQALYYLKKYPTTKELSTLGGTEKSALGWVNDYTRRIQALKAEKVLYYETNLDVQRSYYI